MRHLDKVSNKKPKEIVSRKSKATGSALYTGVTVTQRTKGTA